ncbi:phenazine biosynthesis protein PhzE [Winogradskya consettensis]|uniref:anthranilate synthase n=1 Tax=Winogradskya consettensis TaxID=113560 RepID=A0A919STB0_9ACTN|nr:chorismate-binding protein [Actinoplanes consettensis]GIM76563.1 phenazine-specific anthranilate synthase component I [Actinoplanes consettensis]
MSVDLLTRILSGEIPAYALLHRPETDPDAVQVLAGTVTPVPDLASIRLPAPTGEARADAVVLIPFAQIAERGYAVNADDDKLLVLSIDERQDLPLTAVHRRLPDEPVVLRGTHFDLDDETYATIVANVITDEIGRGAGANFVIRRDLIADITGFSPFSALSFFRRLLRRETGAYWTFLIHIGDRTFVGATPERHVSLRSGVAVMNPISGTYRYPSGGADLPGLLSFLDDPKETDELHMVVDEELKMMARICTTGGRVRGPYLKQMARLAHTEYLIEGETTRDVRDILRETMFAPTVTGSPLENACDVIRRYEPHPRGYYGGILALIGHDARGRQSLDSAILIRTADINATGRLRIGVGSTVVRHSDPRAEAAETRAKAAGLLSALDTGPDRLGSDPQVRERLARRNRTLSGFWLRPATDRAGPVEALTGRRVLVIDAEDTFTAMIAQQLSALGMSVTVRRYDEPGPAPDLVVLGPGPGDPRQRHHPKIVRLRQLTADRLEHRLPFVAVCLSHQVLCTLLDLPLLRRARPNQGVQREITLFGHSERVGFYNTYAAHCDTDEFLHPLAGPVQVSRDRATGEVHALRGATFSSLQFHAESILTEHGPAILAEAVLRLLPARVHQG